MRYFIYILGCSDNSLYTGITNNLEKRMITHRKGKGSKYVCSRLPFILAYSEIVPNKSMALKREIEIKKMSKKEKEILIIH